MRYEFIGSASYDLLSVVLQSVGNTCLSLPRQSVRCVIIYFSLHSFQELSPPLLHLPVHFTWHIFTYHVTQNTRDRIK